MAKFNHTTVNSGSTIKKLNFTLEKICSTIEKLDATIEKLFTAEISFTI